MTRSRASAKAAGSRFERTTADWLAAVYDDRIDRKVKTGAADKGDIGGMRLPGGGRVTIEAKDYGGRFLIGPWLGEAETERVNDGGLAGLVVAKRRGLTDPGAQLAFGTLRDIVALMTGTRPE